MTELSKSNERLTSLNMAEYLGKQHKNILADIREMEPAWEQVTGLRFQPSQYNDSTGRSLPMFSLNKMEWLYVSSKFDNLTRARLIKRWEELERSVPRQPISRKELAQMVIEESDRADQAEAIIEEQKHKVVFADAVTGSINSILVRELAKAISDPDSNGFIIGQNKLFQWLRDQKFLNKKNEPYQNYVEQGLFEVIERTVGASNQTFTTFTTKVTGKGQTYFAKKLRGEIGGGNG